MQVGITTGQQNLHGLRVRVSRVRVGVAIWPLARNPYPWHGWHRFAQVQDDVVLHSEIAPPLAERARKCVCESRQSMGGKRDKGRRNPEKI